MAWRWLVVPAALMAVAALPPVEHLDPSAAAAQPELPVPPPEPSQRVWAVRMEPSSEAAGRGFHAGVAMMDGVRGALVVTDAPDGDIVVRWVEELRGGDRLGQHVLGTPRIDIALGDSRCAGGWTPYDEQTLARAVAHEIGHAVGLEHEGGTVMAERLPASYGIECVRVQDPLFLLPLQVHSATVRIGAASAVAYSVESDGAVDICITPPDTSRLRGWGCSRGVEQASAEVGLPAGSYRVAVRCVAALGCQFESELASRPVGPAD